jgi:hypothetical protein
MIRSLLKAFRNNNGVSLPTNVHGSEIPVKWSDVAQLYLHPDGSVLGAIDTRAMVPTRLESKLRARGINMDNITTIAFMPDKKAFIFTYYDSDRFDFSPSVIGIATLNVSAVKYVYPPVFTDDRFGFKQNADGSYEQTIKIEVRNNTHILHITDQELDGTVIPFNYVAIVTLG